MSVSPDIDAYAVGRVGPCDRPFRVDGSREGRRFVNWRSVRDGWMLLACCLMMRSLPKLYRLLPRGNSRGRRSYPARTRSRHDAVRVSVTRSYTRRWWTPAAKPACIPPAVVFSSNSPPTARSSIWTSITVFGPPGPIPPVSSPSCRWQ